MRFVSTIDRPIADEHVIGVDPPLSPALDGVWRKRINPFTGRSLSDRALTAEQESRAGIQRLRGQNLTAGIVSGLDLMLEPSARGAAPANAHLQVLPGFGLTQTGEDIVVSTPRRIAIGRIPVHARVDILDAIARNGPPPSDPSAEPGNLGMSPLLPRRTGPELGAIIAAPAAAALPRVAILVAEPVTATILAGLQSNCSPDPRDDPYDDLQRIDGIRLTLSFWPSEQIASDATPDYSLPASGPDRRNRLAYRIFDVERGMLPGDMHPWERVGVPIALIAFNPDWTLDFIDRSAVVRLGGQPNPRTSLVPQGGSPILWQARVAQFVEQLAELDDLTSAALTSTFRQLPPAGFLPAGVIDLTTRRQQFFPAGFSLTAAPVPLEHLDLAVRESAGLDPIDLNVPDAIELLVPVPERVYEPGLLETAAVDPAFAQAMARFAEDRTNWLKRREMLRRRRDLLIDAVTGTLPSTPASDLPLTEVLPFPEERAPLLVTRVRLVEAGAALRTLRMVGSGIPMELSKGDRIFVWIRIADAANLRGFSIRLGVITSAIEGGRYNGVFWGAPDGLPISTGDANIDTRKLGDLPDAGVWTRLEAPADARWSPTGGVLTNVSADGLELSQFGGTIEWAAIGKIDQNGNETIWIADDALPGATLRDNASEMPGWPQSPAGEDEVPIEIDAGTSEAAGVRSVNAIERFRERWTQSFLSDDFTDLDNDGIDGFIKGVETRLKATNDAIDVGFVRARADIYRVRQYMLGADAASRLVTSPALADLAARDEGARATSIDLSAFIKTAYQTDFLRNPDEPLETKPKRAAGVPLPPQPAPAPSPGGSSLFFNGIRLSQFSTSTTTPLPTFTTTRTSTFTTATTAPAAAPVAIAAQPRVFTTPAVFAGGAAVPMTGVAAEISPAASFLSSTALSRFGDSAVRADLPPLRAFDPSDIQAQTPLPGVVERSVSVAERLKPSPAVEAHGYAIAGKYAAVNAIAGLLGNMSNGIRPKGIAIGDLPAPGFSYNLATDPLPPRRKNTIGDVIFDRNSRGIILQYDDLDERKAADQRHEADYFTAAVNAIDNTIALMRLVEGRVDLYNKLAADARDVRGQLLGNMSEADARLRVIGAEVEEARHDVSVATALLAEEQDRVEKLNARRAAILAANIKTIVFRRARFADSKYTVPVAAASAALAEAPIAVCLREHDSVPEELRDYAALFRDAPVGWFPAVKVRLDLIDRLEAARKSLVAVRLRAAAPFELTFVRASNPPKMLAVVDQVIGAQRSIIDQRRLAALQLDLAGAAVSELSSARAALADRASLADLIAGDHNRPQLSRLAASEIESIGQVAGCLYASFGEVPPVMRLEWAELLSEFDTPAPLSSLAGLPRWNTLPLELRRTQQGFVDWLFSRIDRSIAPAEGAINELVRIALLLAAHAPVDRIIPARLVAPAPARIGGRLDLAVDIRAVRIGMTAFVRGADSSLIAHAVVDDLAEGVARARIVKVFSAATTIAAGVRIDLSDTRSR